jgi:hypothetical protein
MGEDFHVDLGLPWDLRLAPHASPAILVITHHSRHQTSNPASSSDLNHGIIFFIYREVIPQPWHHLLLP